MAILPVERRSEGVSAAPGKVQALSAQKCKTWLHDSDRDEAELLSDRALGFVA